MTNLHHPEVHKVILVKYRMTTQAVVVVPHDQDQFDAAIEELRGAIERADDPTDWDLVDYRSDPLRDVVAGCIG